jgi:phospholipid transport system transporter-binding protein
MSRANRNADPSFTGGDRWSVRGALNIDTAARVLAASLATPLPASRVVSLDDVHGVDSAAVAVLLTWQRRALGEGKPLQFVAVPPNLAALAQLYGVERLLAPEAETPPAE